MISSINNNSSQSSFKTKKPNQKSRARLQQEAYSAFQRSKLIQQSKLSRSTLNETNPEKLTESMHTINNINQPKAGITLAVKELSESQELRLFNLDYLYRTKVPLVFQSLRCSALDWILLNLFPVDDMGMHFILLFSKLFHS